MNSEQLTEMDVASLNNALRNAEDFLMRARRALGNSSKADAIYNLKRALPLVKRTLAKVQGA